MQTTRQQLEERVRGFDIALEKARLEATEAREQESDGDDSQSDGDDIQSADDNSQSEGEESQSSDHSGGSAECRNATRAIEHSGGSAENATGAERQGISLNVTKSVMPNKSWKDILMSGISDIHTENGHDSVSVSTSIESGDGLAVKENGFVAEVGPRPGARSNVPLRVYSFTPGSPVNDLATDAETVEKLNNCIVGHFLGARMDYYDVRREMFRQWESCGLEKMWCTDNGIYLFKFKGTNRIDEILDEAHCHVFGKVMVLKRWHHMQKLSKDAVLKVPIWVKLYELPFEFWLGSSLGENLSKIASRIGRPLYIDKATEKGMRLSYARVCVEIDVSSVLPDSVKIEYRGESVDVKVIYQWVPQKCEKCGAFGHRDAYCPLNPTPSKQEKETKVVSGNIYGGRKKGGDGKKSSDQNWKVVEKVKGESSNVEGIVQEKNKEVVCSEKYGREAQVKGNLVVGKGLVEGNSFAVLQSSGISDAYVPRKTGTPEPKKVWVESDYPSKWSKSTRKKAARAANLAGPVFQNDPP